MSELHELRFPSDYLESELVSSSEPSSSDVPSSSDSNLPLIPIDLDFFKNNDSWIISKQKLDANINDIAEWGNFVAISESIVQSYANKQHTQEFKNFYKNVSLYLNKLLVRFPYLLDFWKKYSLLEYSVNGLESSIEVLSRAVDLFPRSIDLWVDYINSLLIQENKDLEFIKDQFLLGLKYNGQHFLSHPLWDSYVEFIKTSFAEDSALLLETYKTLIKIPLYSYSNYWQEFSQINKNYSLDQILSHTELTDYLSKYNKSSVDQLEKYEIDKIIDEYTYQIYLQNQAKVSAKWEFESKIKREAFSLVHDNASLEQEEKTNWLNYLDYEIAESSVVHPEYVLALFERCLIPNCLDEQIWSKYVSWYNQYQPTAYTEINTIFLKGINSFLPLDKNKLRASYPFFLELNGKIEDINSYYLSAISLFHQLGNNSSYLQFIADYLRFWQRHLDFSTFEQITSKIIKDNLNIKNDLSFETLDENKQINLISTYATTLSGLLNESAISIVTVVLLKHLQLQSCNKKEAVQSIRKWSNDLINYNQFSYSVPFYSFLVTFEIRQKNIKNLKSLYHQISTSTQLPKKAIDDLLTTIYEFLGYQANNDLVYIDNDTSNSFTINKSLKTRLIKYNSKFNDPEAKSANPEAEFNKYWRNNIAHPGIETDYYPEITNKIADDFPLTSVPPLPSFKNVEKANMAIKYPEL